MSAAPPALGPLAPLGNHRQFIPVKLVLMSDGRTEKYPIDYRTGAVTIKGSGGAHDPAIWLDYATAAVIAEGLGLAHGQRYGVGFVLTAGDPFACVDIDHALQPDASWPQWVLDLCAALPGSVCELSQSGRGLHLWLRSSAMPEHAKRSSVQPGLECYSSKRFVLLGSGAVGRMADDCAGIRDVIARYFPPTAATSGIALPDDGPRVDWCGPPEDDELIRRMLSARHSAAGAFGGRATPTQLWTADAGALAHFFPHASEPFNASDADAALFQHLAYWCGCDAARMERIARRSALVRDKWDRDDYMEVTIAKACKQQGKVLRDPPTLESAIAQIQAANGADARAMWLELAVPMSAADTDAFLHVVEAAASLGRQALNATLREGRAALKREQRAQAIAERTRERTLIEWKPEDCMAQALTVESLIVASATPGDYVNFAGTLSQVVLKPLPFTHLIDKADAAPPAVPQIAQLDKVSMIGHAERVVAFYQIQATGAPKLIAVPDRLLDVLLDKREHAAPTVSGLVTHPVVLRDGTILATDGLHAGTGLFLSGAGVVAARPYAQHEAHAALQRLRSTFLDGFEFATQLDADVALAGLFTGVQRRLLDSAPGLAVLAATQSSGKTTLPRRIHLMLTGHDMPASTFALGDESEIRKALLALLLRNPAMVCFDNVQDGFTFASGTLAAAMTSASIEQRILGGNRDANPATNVLFTMTGNNLSLGNDEVTRWMVSRLAPATSRPQERTFRNPDVVAHAHAIRAQVLADTVGIVAGSSARQ